MNRESEKKRIQARTQLDEDYIFNEFKNCWGQEHEILTKKKGELNYIWPSDHRALLGSIEIPGCVLK
jgi:hypothetical protein